MKLVVVILVVAVQVAGPWLCCCTARLFAPSAGSCQEACAAKSACPHCPAAPSKPTEAPKPAPKSPAECPCCWVLTPTTPAVVPAKAVVPDTPDDVSGFLAVVDESAASRPALADADRLPFLSAESKLFAHHVLRC